MLMRRVAVIGCGIVGAAIAYELSQTPGLAVTVLDQQPPAQAATGAALGVLMGIISQKIKGHAWHLRQDSIQRYATLVPELEAITGRAIPFNRQGILKLCFEGENMEAWETLASHRFAQGWQLDIWDCHQLQSRCPQIVNPRVTGAIYSPHDRQVDPTALTLALVETARHNGATVQLDAIAHGLKGEPQSANLLCCHHLDTSAGSIAVDWVIIAAGLGSTPLSQTAAKPVDIRPVLGQAIQVRFAEALGDRHFQPVITGEDIHLVPLTGNDYWVGATVEFPVDSWDVAADPKRLEEVWTAAIALCPALANAEILKTWSGLRPRPQNRPAPIIEPLAGYSNVLLATGHYRNGVLLAPATAQAIRDLICNSL